MRKIYSFLVLFFLCVCMGRVAYAGGGATLAARMQIEVAEGVVIDMVYVPEGRFTMGATAEQGSCVASDESPAHEVVLSGYYIATTECTQALWSAVMRWNNSAAKGDNMPVTNVNVYDCNVFLNELSAQTGYSFRLPTEAEWEYAARGGAMSGGTKYSGSATLVDVAWFSSNASQPSPVARKQANELGLYDMSGNVYEICSDEYAAYTAELQYDPQGGESDQQVFRGGAYISEPADCRTSVRSYAPTDYRDAFIGFRLVMKL